jgi:hypothetical protein
MADTLLRIRGIPGSYLGPETVYPDWGFPWLFLIPTGESRDSVSKFDRDFFLKNPLQYIIHLSPFNSMLYILSYWKSVVK